LIANQIPATFTDNLDDFCRRYKEETGARVTIIGSTGRVLGDSDEPSVTMENHMDRPEIKDAEVGDLGSSIRYSKTLHKNLFYLAIAASLAKDKYFLRLSMPLHDVENAMNTIRIRIIIASPTVLFGYYSRYFRRKITKPSRDHGLFKRCRCREFQDKGYSLRKR
jgi:two-component system phosphate regulon sensor histidine kinase PhoR